MVEAPYSFRSKGKQQEIPPCVTPNSEPDQEYVDIQNCSKSSDTTRNSSDQSNHSTSAPATPLSRESSSNSISRSRSPDDELLTFSKKIKVDKTIDKTANPQWTFLPVNARTIISSRSGLDTTFPNAVDCDSLFDYRLDDLGGLQSQIKEVSESLFLPIRHPELVKKFNIKPARGFLFHGPPGTGKTSVARALASKASDPESSLAYFQFTASDILSKNVGESEAKLTAIFNAAKQWQPSIIFFDEIDGLIPARLDTDRPSASLVATFLHLMDGMGEKGNIVVIGSTNRLASLDLAMRRPGRIEEEIYFPLPTAEARFDILNLIIGKWNSPPSSILLQELAQRTAGFSGADLKALCSRATINALTRLHPDVLNKKQNNSENITESNFAIDHNREDFLTSLASITPSSQRALGFVSIPLPQPASELLASKVQETLEYINNWADFDTSSDKLPEKLPVNVALDYVGHYTAPVIVLKGSDSVSRQHVLSSVVQRLDRFRVFDLDPFAACSQLDRSGAAFIQRQLDSLKKSEQGIFLIREAHTYFEDCSPKVAAILKMALLVPYKPGQVTFLVTSQGPVSGLGSSDRHTIIDVDQVSSSSLRCFCSSFLEISMAPKNTTVKRQLRNRTVVNSPKITYPKLSEVDPEGFSDAIDVLVRDLVGLLPGQILGAVGRLDMSEYRSFSDFLQGYTPSSSKPDSDSIIFGATNQEVFDKNIPALDD